MRASAASDLSNQLGWIGDRVTMSCEGVAVATWVVIDEDEHRRRGGSGAVASIQELHRRIGPNPDTASSSAPPLRIVGVACGPTPWRDAASAIGRYVTVAPRVVILDDEEANDDIVRAEARMWGIGLVVDAQVVAWPSEPEVELGIYQWWLAEECYQTWLRGSPKPRSVV